MVSGTLSLVVTSFSSSAPRVKSLVVGPQILRIDVGVDLGRTDIGVAKKFLHRPEISAPFE